MIKFNDDCDLVNDCVWILGFFTDHYMKKTIHYLSNLNVLHIIVKVLAE